MPVSDECGGDGVLWRTDPVSCRDCPGCRKCRPVTYGPCVMCGKDTDEHALAISPVRQPVCPGCHPLKRERDEAVALLRRRSPAFAWRDEVDAFLRRIDTEAKP